MTRDPTFESDWSGLPDVPLPAALAERVHARARAVFETASAPNRTAAVATYVAVTAAVVGYLGWAVAFVRALAPA
ncbi:MAG TPA: hypothetical protein VN962_25400 [Polyangia bacterium]|nr:hypothetical protein [Polyangia bacterium]